MILKHTIFKINFMSIPKFCDLVFNDVSFRYSGSEMNILDSISFKLERGEKIGIIGDNGTGKSTISKLILGVYTPNHGSIIINGEPISWSYHYPYIAYVGDPGYSTGQMGLPFDLSVQQFIEINDFILKNNGFNNSLYTTSELLGLNDFYNQKIIKLSTGQRKRLMLCLALGKPCELLILDEPFDGLDRLVKRQVEQLLTELCFSGLTLIYISHNSVEIDTYTDKVYELAYGKLIEKNRALFGVNIKQGSQSKALNVKSGQFQGIVQDLFQEEETTLIEPIIIEISKK